MARPTQLEWRLPTKSLLGERLSQIRRVFEGDPASLDLACLLNIPAETWANYEQGVTIPGEVLLAFIVLTNVEPRWLFDGTGARFRPVIEVDER